MVSKKIEKALNEQIALEGYASFLYLSMASWCDQQGLDGCSKFMHRQSTEELSHMMRIFHYLSEIDGHAITPAISQPPLKFKSIRTLLAQVYKHEQKVTNSIHKIVDLCYKETDYTTLHFLQWYIDEQREEEALMRNILDRIKLIGDGPQSLFYIDKELDKINQVQAAAEAAANEQGAA